MTSRTASLVLIVFDILAIGGLVYCYNEHVSLMNQINSRAKQIVFDSGLYYGSMASIMLLIQFILLFAFLFKSKVKKLPASGIAVFWFIGCLLFANLMPLYIESVISDAGYHQCGDTVYHRTSKGGNTHYSLSKCLEANNN